MIALVKRPEPSRMFSLAAPLLAVLATMFFGGLLFALLGKAPLEAIRTIFWEPLFGEFAFFYRPQLLIKGAPLVLIAIGLGIGAMYVRSMTIMLVEKGTLTTFCYLENGAFWSILTLAFIMFAQTVIDVPEYVTGLLGAGLIGAALWSSLQARNGIGAAELPQPPLP